MQQLRQQPSCRQLPGCGGSRASPQAPAVCRQCAASCRRPGTSSSRRLRGGTTTAVAAAGGSGAVAATADEQKRKPGRPTKKAAAAAAAAEEEQDVMGVPDMPMPLDYQQTLVKSFTMGGVGLHTGEYAWVRVRPAHAGEGRYFVRVPEGTNKPRFKFDGGNLEDETPIEEALQDVPPDEDIEDLKVSWFSVYLVAQDERGFEGSFRDFLRMQVELGELPDELRIALLGGPDDDELETAATDYAPDLSCEPEEIVPLDPDDPTLVMAAITSVSTLDMPCTQLGEGDKRVVSTELLLAALEACGIDNARIEVEGGHELPVLDNSALGWCVEIQGAGARPAPLRFDDQVPDDAQPILMRDAIMPSQGVAVQDEDGWIAFFPGPVPMLTSGVDAWLNAPVIGTQWFTWHVQDLHFRFALAPARAYVESVEQLFQLRAAGFVKAGAENLFLIADGDRWHDEDMVRMVFDEPARFRASQLVGNLALLNVAGCQGIPVGHITAFNAGPALQLRFVQALVGAVHKGDVLPLSEVLRKQGEWYAARQRVVVERSSSNGAAGRQGTSRGPPPDMGDGSPAVVDAELVEEEEEGEADGDEGDADQQRQ